MRIVRLATGLAAALALIACESVIEPLADTNPEVPAPSFARHSRVVQSVTGGTGFLWTQPSTGQEVWRTSSLSARKYADGSVTGTFQANYHGLYQDKGRITCFTAVGNEAWLGVVVESSNVERRLGDRVIYVQDNGEGSKAEPDLSTAMPRLRAGFENLDDYCTRAPLERPDHGVHELEAGNIQVFNSVVEQISGSANFHYLNREDQVIWRTSSLIAQRHAHGSVTGHYLSNSEAGVYNEGRITCFTIIGNEGWLGMIIEAASDPDRVGEERIVYVQDNGGGWEADRSTRLPPLRITGLPDLDTYCAETPEIRASSVFDIEEGDIQIHR